MRKIKIILMVIIASFFMVGLASCTSTETESETSTTSSSVVSDDSSEEGSVVGSESELLPPPDMSGGLTEESTESLSATEVAAYTTQEIFESDKDASKKDLINTYDDDYETLDLSAGDVEITEAGTYMLSGTYTDTTVTVNVLDDDKVTLLLNDLTVTNTDSAVIYVLNADKVYVNVIDDSESTLTVTDTFAETEEGIDAVIYSKDDLTVKGTGTLNIESTDTGIKSKDDLVLSSLTLNVTALNNGVIGKDSLVVASGTYNVVAEGDAMKSNGDEEDGVFIVNDGTFNLTSGDDSISATNLVLLEAGTYNITSSDDAIKSDNDIVIEDGTYVISAVDDAVSAEYDLQVNGGTITVTTCYEGLEGKTVQVNAGTINITSTDDGINASDPDDSEVTESNDPDGNYHSTSEDVIFSQFGGDIFIDTDADGVDSNGNIYIDGGTLTISGCEADNENPMDYNLNAVIVSGDVVSVGYSGMAQNFTVSDTNVSVMYNFTQQAAGSVVEITDSEGETVFTYTLLKSASSVLISNDLLVADSTYTISVGTESVEFSTTDSTVVTVGLTSTTSGPGGMMPGRR